MSWETVWFGLNQFPVVWFLVLIRADSRFFSGILHPHLLGDCRPNLFLAESNRHINPVLYESKHPAHAHLEEHRRGQLVTREVLIYGQFHIRVNFDGVNVELDPWRKQDALVTGVVVIGV